MSPTSPSGLGPGFSPIQRGFSGPTEDPASVSARAASMGFGSPRARVDSRAVPDEEVPDAFSAAPRLVIPPVDDPSSPRSPGSSAIAGVGPPKTIRLEKPTGLVLVEPVAGGVGARVREVLMQGDGATLKRRERKRENKGF